MQANIIGKIMFSFCAQNPFWRLGTEVASACTHCSGMRWCGALHISTAHAVWGSSAPLNPIAAVSVSPACSSCPGDLDSTISLPLWVQQHLFQEIKHKSDKFPYKSKLHLCTGFGWDRVIFFPSSALLCFGFSIRTMLLITHRYVVVGQ